MRLSKIKTKEIRYVVWKYRLKRFLPHILTLCLAVIVAGGAFSAYSVYHKKHQKQLAKQSEVQREKDVNTARKKAQKEKTTLKPWYTYHSIAHAMGGGGRGGGRGGGGAGGGAGGGGGPAGAVTLLIRRVIVSLKWTSFLLRTTLRLGSTNGVGNFLIQPVKKATQSVTVNSKILRSMGNIHQLLSLMY